MTLTLMCGEAGAVSQNATVYKDTGCQGTALHAATLKGGSHWNLYKSLKDLLSLNKREIEQIDFPMVLREHSVSYFIHKQKKSKGLFLSGKLLFHVCPVGGDIYT